LDLCIILDFCFLVVILGLNFHIWLFLIQSISGRKSFAEIILNSGKFLIHSVDDGLMEASLLKVCVSSYFRSWSHDLFNIKYAFSESFNIKYAWLQLLTMRWITIITISIVYLILVISCMHNLVCELFNNKWWKLISIVCLHYFYYEFIFYGLVNHTPLSSMWDCQYRRGKMYMLNFSVSICISVWLPTPFVPNYRLFWFFRYIAFAIHLDICYVNLCV